MDFLLAGSRGVAPAMGIIGERPAGDARSPGQPVGNALDDEESAHGPSFSRRLGSPERGRKQFGEAVLADRRRCVGTRHRALLSPWILSLLLMGSVWTGGDSKGLEMTTS